MSDELLLIFAVQKSSLSLISSLLSLICRPRRLMGFSRVTSKRSTGPFGFPSGTVPFRIPSLSKLNLNYHSPAVIFKFNGDDGIRTHDPLLAGQVLSQLSYTPILKVLGISEE